MSIEDIADTRDYLDDDQFDNLRQKISKIKDQQQENNQQLQLLRNKVDWVLREPESNNKKRQSKRSKRYLGTEFNHSDISFTR